MEEIWKDVVGYEELIGKYEVSNFGNVRRKKNKKIISKQVTNRGYLEVRIQVNKKRKHYLVHRLVALAFIPNPENKPQVDHIDTNRLNNKADNLRWVTQHENNLNEKTLEKMRNAHNNGFKVKCLNNGIIYKSMYEAGRELNISRQFVKDVCNGKYKSAKGFNFIYV